MKPLVILLLSIIAFILGYGEYQDYQRYNSPNTNYKTDKKLDFDYHDQELVINYNKAIETLNSYVTIQWSANSIDVRTPKEDNDEIKLAVDEYAKKLATIKYYETKLEKSSTLKNKGLSNKEIHFLEETGTDLETHKKSLANNKIKSMFNANTKINYGQKSALIYEIQKKLIANGFEVTPDGVYKIETFNAIRSYEEKNNLFVDGFLDALTLDSLFK